MANIVSVDRVSKGYGPAGQLLVDVSLGLDEAGRIGVVGLNGAGKSTLLRLLTKAEEPDAGRVSHRRGLAVAALPQTLRLDRAATVRDVVLGEAWLPAAFEAEHEWAGDAGIRTVLTGLGLPGLGLEAPVDPLSGGQRRRVALAALLVRHTDLLVLDEPTNHLDLAGVDWLARHLRTRRGALVVVTHDRWFLDAVCQQTWEVVDRAVRVYEGGYAAWVLARAERDRLAAVTEERRQNLLRKEIAWLRRGPPARTSKPKFRIDAANALIADVPLVRDKVSLQRLAVGRLGKQVYELIDADVRIGERELFAGINWLLGPGERVGLLGANGTGKSTLLRVLAGLRALDGGRLVTGTTVRSAFLSQELAELPEQLRLLEAVEDIARRVEFGGRELSASQLAELFGFTGDRLWTPVSDLSGGERRRLQMLRLLAGEPNVLLLDEPTNDLDTDTLAALEDLFDTWPGTLVVASHDRYLLERVCDTVYALGDGRLTYLTGGVEEYLARLAESAPGPGLSASASASAGPGASAAAQSELTASAARVNKKELARLERQAAKLGERVAAIHAEMAASATDYQAVAALDESLRAASTELEQVEQRWYALADGAD